MRSTDKTSENDNIIAMKNIHGKRVRRNKIPIEETGSDSSE